MCELVTDVNHSFEIITYYYILKRFIPKLSFLFPNHFCAAKLSSIFPKSHNDLAQKVNLSWMSEQIRKTVCKACQKLPFLTILKMSQQRNGITQYCQICSHVVLVVCLQSTSQVFQYTDVFFGIQHSTETKSKYQNMDLCY